jgi:peptide subunit release factor 1 (eRF1)
MIMTNTTSNKQQWEYYCPSGHVVELTSPPERKTRAISCPECRKKMSLRIKKENK